MSAVPTRAMSNPARATCAQSRADSRPLSATLIAPFGSRRREFRQALRPHRERPQVPAVDAQQDRPAGGSRLRAGQRPFHALEILLIKDFEQHEKTELARAVDQLRQLVLR